MAMMARQITLGAMFEKNARLHSNRVALVCGRTSVAYSELNAKSNQVAEALKARGVSKGTRVAVLMHNCHEWIEILGGLSKLGAVLVPLNWRLAPAEMLHVIRDSDSVVMVYGHDFEDTARSLQVELGGGVAAIDGGLVLGDAGAQAPGGADPGNEVSMDDVAVQMYTAAFSGLPRGAQITHGGYLASVMGISATLGINSADCSLIALPFFHTFGLEFAMATLSFGGRCVILDPFDAVAAAEALERRGVSLLPCVGQHLAEILQEMDKRPRDICSLRLVMGSAASKDTRAAVREWAPRARFVDCVYGQTECGAMVTGCDTEEGEAVGDRCAGRATMCAEVRIHDENDIELPPGEVGEIVVRGPRVMAGYYKLPDVNQEALRHGWLHTSDLGRLDDQGYLHYVGRKRELIKSGMENIYPVEVESVLAAHPGVREVAVIGVPDEKWGEAVMAIVALKEHSSVSADELMQFCKERMASYKKPKYVRFVEGLPRDEGGQIARQELRDGYGAASSR